MPIEQVRFPVLLIAALAVAGCATTGKPLAQADSSLGAATRQTLAAQIIDPAPAYADAVQVSSGNHATQAIDRYNTDKVKQPEKIKTSTIGGGSSGVSSN